MRGAVVVARTARERHNYTYAEPFRQPDALANRLVGRLRFSGGGVQRVVVARQRADLKARVRDPLPELAGLRRVREQRVRIQMLMARPAAGAELNRGDVLQCANAAQHRRRIEVAEHGREQSEFHRVSAKVSALTRVHTPPRRWLSRIASTTSAQAYPSSNVGNRGRSRLRSPSSAM